MAAASTTHEERGSERHRTVLYYRVTRAGSGGEDFGHVIDVSERGLLLLRRAPLEPRSSWELVVDCGKPVLGRSSIRVAGQVRWCRPSVTPDHFDCGIQIKAIDRRDAEVLRHLARHHSFDSTE